MRPLALALTALLAALPAHGDVPGPRPQQVTVHHDDVGDLPILGPRHAPVTIDFFINLDGRRSLRLHQDLVALAQRHPRRLRVIYRLVAESGDGALAQAAMEAYAQGRFLPFLAELGAHIEGTERMLPPRGPAFRAACERAGVDWEQVEAAQADGRHLPVIEDNLLVLRRRDVPPAPSVLLNGALPGVRATSLTLDQLESSYDAAYAAARAYLDDGVPLEHLYELMLRDRDLAARPVPITVGKVDGAAAAGRHGLLEDTPLVAPHSGGRAQGPESAPVIVRFYGNFLSGDSAQLARSLGQLRDRYPDELRLIVHPMFPADVSDDDQDLLLLVHQAAVCADAQGAFWRFYQLAFREYQHRRMRGMKLADQLEEILRRIGLDRDRFRACMADPDTLQAVIAELEAGRSAGVTLSPTVVVNGRMYSGTKQLIELQSLVDQELLPGLLEQLVPTLERERARSRLPLP